MPELKWRLASSFPKSLDTIYGAGEDFAKRVAAITDNKFQIRVFAAGEIVPGLQVVDAVQNETVECGHTAAYYYVGKDPTFAFDTAVPFGLNTRQHNAWVYYGGGLELMREFYKEAIAVACGDTNTHSVAKYDVQNPKALRELVASGTKFLPFPQSVMEASFNAANELYAETVAKNPKFKKVYDSWKPFRNEEVLWFRVVENTFDNFMARQSAANKL